MFIYICIIMNKNIQYFCHHKLRNVENVVKIVEYLLSIPIQIAIM